MNRILILLTLVFITSASFIIVKDKPLFYIDLEKYCNGLIAEESKINEERKSELKDIAAYIFDNKKAHKPANLIFMCTGNCSRSHFVQVMAQTAAIYYGIDSVWTFSGGTEETEIPRNTIDALRRTGMKLNSNLQSANPLWYISLGPTIPTWALFSKKVNSSTNPQKDYCAIMVCSEIDIACPDVEGADYRVGLPYNDPKKFDNTPDAIKEYNNSCQLIGREMFYLMHCVKEKIISNKK